MYKLSDYLRNGLLFVNNTLRPRHKRLTQLMIYSTTVCQSRCKHCNIWQKPHESLSLADIKRLMASRCITEHTVVGLEGGEFVLHPEADEILNWFSKHHKHFTLLSNCLAADKVIRAVKAYKPEHLYLSLDGDRETYQRMRGRDGYDKVIRVIEECKDVVPVSLMFCLSPWNSFKDMEHVISIAKQFHIDVRIGIYGTMDFFDTTSELIVADGNDYLQSIPQTIHNTEENYDFVALYDEWRNGHLRLRCHSIYNCLVIHSNGDVPLCQNLGVVLGNIHEQSLDDILSSRSTVKTQCKYSHECNKCWINFHRKFDIILLRNIERFVPKRLIEMVYGKYQWCEDARQTYRGYFKKIM